jgi:acetyl-CoA carboxylase carboxyl transferase subunit alpha
VIDGIIPEPMGGAHRNPAMAMEAVGRAIDKTLFDLGRLDGAGIRAQRRTRFLAIGRSLAPMAE